MLIIPCFLLRVVEGGLKLSFVNSVELTGEGHGHVVPTVAVMNEHNILCSTPKGQ